MIYDRIKELCKKKGITVSYLEIQLGFAKGSLCKIDKHNPTSEKLQLISGYFNTSVEYLINGKEPEFSIEIAKIDVDLSNMSDRLKEYALKLASLPKDKQEHVMSLIDMLK